MQPSSWWGSYTRSPYYLTLLLLIILTPALQYGGFTGGLTRNFQTMSTHACDGHHAKLTCPATTVISIQYAKYGRSVPSSLMCSPATATPRLQDLLLYGNTPLLENTNCIAVRSLEID